LENATHASRAAGNLFFDAQIAAILREWGVREFYTHDRDFVKFHDLKVIDPCE
jgi:predicted nucleic acid-binding protein